MKVCHLSVLRGFAGLAAQLSYEQSAAKTIEGVDWEVKAFFAVSNNAGGCVRRLPPGFRGLVSRKLFAWLWLCWNARKYDWVLMRYDPADPFGPIFAPFIPRRISVHHTKEIETMPATRSGWRGALATRIERFCGHRTIRHADAILAVTDEIRDYQCNRIASFGNRPSAVYPNGVMVDLIQLGADKRPSDYWVMGFMATQFQPWHGLEHLLTELRIWVQSETEKDHKGVLLHLMGQISAEQKTAIDELNALAPSDRLQIKTHGHLNASGCQEVFSQCHIGLGSFGFGRDGLMEGSTFKVREMLAYGVPVYSGHKDAALSEDFPYYQQGKPEIQKILDFAQLHSQTSRERVRAAATPWIDKKHCVARVVNFLQTLPR